MTDAYLMDAKCKHGTYWDECTICKQILMLQGAHSEEIEQYVVEFERLKDLNERLMDQLFKLGWRDS